MIDLDPMKLYRMEWNGINESTAVEISRFPCLTTYPSLLLSSDVLMEDIYI
jgi:hypothetical protein